MESNNFITDEIEAEDSLSIDDFLKELEAKEKDLHIAGDISVIEIEDIIEDEESLDFLFSDTAGEKSLPAPSSVEIQTSSTETSENTLLRRQLTQLEVECQELKTVIQRRQTDFENFRQRTERERSETFSSQVGNLARQILPVLDNLDRALDIAPEIAEGKQQDFQHFLDGIVLVNQQLNEVLAGMGVEPIISLGEPFNPQYHEAVSAEKSEEFPPNTVIEELLRGYRIGERVIRPSMVKVSN